MTMIQRSVIKTRPFQVAIAAVLSAVLVWLPLGAFAEQHHADPAETRPVFRRLRELQKAHARPGMELKTLSMGMTNDYAVAVEEGATLLRIGTALFGERKV